jgi:histone H3/H4
VTIEGHGEWFKALEISSRILDRIARHLAYQVGIVRLSHEALEMFQTLFVSMSEKLVRSLVDLDYGTH